LSARKRISFFVTYNLIGGQVKGFDIFVSREKAMERLLKFLSRNKFRHIKINDEQGWVAAEKREGLFKKKDTYIFTVRPRPNESITEIRVKVNPEEKEGERKRASMAKAEETRSVLSNYF
jgi:hypothetical protein